KKQPHLTHQQIPQKLQNFQIDSHQIHDFFHQFNHNHITLLNQKHTSHTHHKINPNHFTPPPPLKINHPLPIYLNQIPRLNLLTAQQQIHL
ncbi:RNA polymerase sigma factor region1.1 domain-containing protein, partial [Staphylococcus epidermidis]|uniref:RNA polymerase sigma factor region1.1 domain-containing protein n=1 Tax=Staphylococcus epidermidis TaxID=1282 RepID=UPI0037D9DB47